jgi:hypothetical protein
MKQSCQKYTPEDISRFTDGELSKEQTENLTKHLEQCHDCKNLATQYKSLSSRFNAFTDRKISQFDSAKTKQKLEQIIQNPEKNSLGNIFGLFGKNLYLKFASIAVIFIISMFIFQGKLLTPAGPSAIVKYVDTDFASVMIIETQKEQHTIIWFSET